MAFRRGFQLQTHVGRAHERTRSHECVNCKRRFATWSERAAHALTHTGEQPYQCWWCEMRLTEYGAKHARGEVQACRRADAAGKRWKMSGDGDQIKWDVGVNKDI